MSYPDHRLNQLPAASTLTISCPAPLLAPHNLGHNLLSCYGFNLFSNSLFPSLDHQLHGGRDSWLSQLMMHLQHPELCLVPDTQSINSAHLLNE